MKSQYGAKQAAYDLGKQIMALAYMPVDQIPIVFEQINNSVVCSKVKVSTNKYYKFSLLVILTQVISFS